METNFTMQIRTGFERMASSTEDNPGLQNVGRMNSGLSTNEMRKIPSRVERRTSKMEGNEVKDILARMTGQLNSLSRDLECLKARVAFMLADK